MSAAGGCPSFKKPAASGVALLGLNLISPESPSIEGLSRSVAATVAVRASGSPAETTARALWVGQRTTQRSEPRRWRRALMTVVLPLPTGPPGLLPAQGSGGGLFRLPTDQNMGAVWVQIGNQADFKKQVLERLLSPFSSKSSECQIISPKIPHNNNQLHIYSITTYKNYAQTGGQTDRSCKNFRI